MRTINKLPFILCFGKGATSWEFQIDVIVFRVCHLKGKYWRFKPWRRFSVTKYTRESQYGTIHEEQ